MQPAIRPPGVGSRDIDLGRNRAVRSPLCDIFCCKRNVFGECQRCAWEPARDIRGSRRDQIHTHMCELPKALDEAREILLNGRAETLRGV